MRTVLLCTFLFVSGAPLAVFWLWPHSVVLENEMDGVEERHLVIAKNLSLALQTYHRDVVSAFSSFAPLISEGGGQEATPLFQNLHFRHICVADMQSGELLVDYPVTNVACPSMIPTDRLEMFWALASPGSTNMSPVYPIANDRPRIFIVTEVDNKLVVGAIYTTYFINLQKEVTFGERGHAAIVDQIGQALAHPLPEWAMVAKDLSKVPPVQRTMAGQSGVLTFFSPAMKEEMIAGYSTVDGVGWGVLIPQPMSELEAVATRVKRTSQIILIVGLAISALLSLWIASFIAQRVNLIENAATRMAMGQRNVRVSSGHSRFGIRELGRMRDAFNRMAHEIEQSDTTKDRLRQTQKMEALGQLTGGVAHDFNNLLTVIRGNAELLASEDKVDDTLTSPIVQATQMGAELTQRLLAFSRQQALNAETVDLNLQIGEVTKMLTRTLGGQITIKTRLSPDLWDVVVDANQLSNVLLNLAINARDAMDGTGKIRIDCVNSSLSDSDTEDHAGLEAGDYVVLSVSDDGKGMSPEVRARAFEPFFTTKDVGEGTGLGLSMVYGFAKQTGGHVELWSEPGVGTTVRLYLPRATADGGRKGPAGNAGNSQGNGEFILLIEDMKDVRETTKKSLRKLGYRVIDVEDAVSAHAILRAGRRIDLVLCDVILPGSQSGIEFARSLHVTYPGLGVVLMSGYPDEVLDVGSLAGTICGFLQKPFRQEELAAVIRDGITQDMLWPT